MIFSQSLPESKSFFGRLTLSALVARYLTKLMVGFLDHRGRMSADRAASSIASAARHRAGVGRFLGGRGGSLRWLRHRLTRQLLDLEAVKGIYLLILDATDVSQQGEHVENTFHTGNRQRRPKKGRRYNKYKHKRRTCHRHVMGLLLTPSGHRVPYYRPYYTHEHCKKKGLPHRTQADLGAEIIQTVSVPEGSRLVVVGDTAFESKQVRHACKKRGFSWIMPPNCERVLAGEKPRPKVSSLWANLRSHQFVPVRLIPGKGPFAALQRAATCRIGPKTKTSTFYVHQERHCVHSVGDVQIVFSTKQQPENDKPIPRDQVKILLTNDLSLTVDVIVALYALRWQIEVFFKELKSVLGMHQYQFAEFHRVETWVEACLITYIYLEWVRLRRLQSNGLTDKERRWWTSQRSYGLASAVRQGIAEQDLRTLHEQMKSPYRVKKLRKLLRNALPKEYRYAA
jgi:hypothetical protein